MTVTRRKQQTCEYPNSANPSDTESIHLSSASASDVESLHNEPVPRRSMGNNFPQVFNEFYYRKKSLGKRSQRRTFNRIELEALAEEDDELTLELMEKRPTPLTLLTQDADALKIWNDFNALSEEEQSKYINPLPKENLTETMTKSKPPMSRICSKIKRALKIKRPFPTDMIRKMENEIIAYFSEHPVGLFKSCPNTSFERLMVHGVAQYHNLQSISTFVNTVRCVEINGNSQLWKPVEESFFNAINQLRR